MSCVRSCFAVAGACDTAARAPFACRYGPIRYRVTLGLLRTDLQFGTLGYVPRRRNEMPARLMDAGKRLSARAESIAQRGSWLNIQVSLYLDHA